MPIQIMLAFNSLDLFINLVRERVVDVQVLQLLSDSFKLYVRNGEFFIDLACVIGLIMIIIEFDHIESYHVKFWNEDHTGNVLAEKLTKELQEIYDFCYSFNTL